MLSPFPGMNPYLEDPAIWPGVHTSLISEIRNRINAQAPRRYFADIEERVYVLDQDDPAHRLIIPDVSVRDFQPNEVGGRMMAEQNSAAGGVATLVAPVRAAILGPLDHTERRIVIRTLEGEHIVTVIEVLSPTNKTRGSDGRTAYMKKRAEVLNSDAHFIEIDLLRGGERMPAAANVVFKKKSDYRIVVSRAAERPMADWWLIDLPQPLPPVPVPLSPGDPDLTIDLQSTLHHVYDDVRYDRRINYHRPPPPPELPPDQQTWLARQVAAIPNPS